MQAILKRVTKKQLEKIQINEKIKELMQIDKKLYSILNRLNFNTFNSNKDIITTEGKDQYQLTLKDIGSKPRMVERHNVSVYVDFDFNITYSFSFNLNSKFNIYTQFEFETDVINPIIEYQIKMHKQLKQLCVSVSEFLKDILSAEEKELLQENLKERYVLKLKK